MIDPARTPEDRQALTDLIRETLRSPGVTISRVHLPPRPGSPLQRCCADLCDPSKVAALADRTARQESNLAPDPQPSGRSVDEFMERMFGDLAPDAAVPDELDEDGTNLSYEQVLDLAAEIALDDPRHGRTAFEYAALLLRTLDGLGVRIW